jgi:hypothetical protein
MQVLYASPPRQASTATSFSDFQPARAQASLWLFSLFVFVFPCFAFVSLQFFCLVVHFALYLLVISL